MKNFIIIGPGRCGSSMVVNYLNKQKDIICHHEVFNIKTAFLNSPTGYVYNYPFDEISVCRPQTNEIKNLIKHYGVPEIKENFLKKIKQTPFKTLKILQNSTKKNIFGFNASLN